MLYEYKLCTRIVNLHETSTYSTCNLHDTSGIIICVEPTLTMCPIKEPYRQIQTYHKTQQTLHFQLIRSNLIKFILPFKLFINLLNVFSFDENLLSP